MSRARLRSRPALAVSLVAPLALIGLAVALGAAGSDALQRTVTIALCNLVIVLGLQLFIGNSGVYSFGQIGFAAIGAYVATLCTLPAAFVALQTPGLPGWIADAHLAPLTALGAAALCCGLLAAIVGLPLMRTSTLAIPISTFAFLIVAYNVLANWDAVSGGSAGLVSIPRSTGLDSAGLWAGVAVAVALAYKFSASGYRLQASRENEVAASSLGIGVLRERLIAFVLSAMLCGVGGALVAHQSGVLAPSTFYFAATVTTLTMLVVGGVRSVFGAVIGSLAVASVNELLHQLEAGAHLLGPLSIGEVPGLAAIGLGLILLVTMIAMPGGLSGGREAGEFLRRSSAALPAVDGSTSGRRPEGGTLRAEQIAVAFGGLRVLEGVDLELGRGEALGLIGPNGAGKTTLLNVLSGFQPPDAGEVSLDGVEVGGLSPARLARAGVGRTFQAALPFAHFSCLESVAVGALGIGSGRREAVTRAAMILERLGLADLASQPAGSLTAASQRLLGVARALATGPDYLLLDEPAAGLNQAEREHLVATLGAIRADFGCGILLVEHEMSVVMELCARVQVLDGGGTLRIGTPAEIQADPVVIEAYLGHSYLASADA